MRARVFVGGAVIAALALLMAGYASGWFDSDSDRIGQSLRAALPESPLVAETTLRLDELVEGDWDRLVITCYGMKLNEIRRVLGQETQPDDAETQGSTVVIYFMVENDIETIYVRDADVNGEPVYFEPCSSNDDLIHAPIVLSREEAQLTMERDRIVPERWVLASS